MTTPGVTRPALRVKIFGAGSIGNHLANAARSLGWDVVVADLDKAALERMRNEIYPTRYGVWDEAITLCTNADMPVGGFDLICVGTPPPSHLPLALSALDERPRAILVEKPLCPPSLEHAHDLWTRLATSPARLFVGYDHVVGRAARRAETLLRDGAIGAVRTIDVEFREHWSGIFAAHPWLRGPEDSYLGFWEQGGGASGEHSHALNLWQHFAHLAGGGRVVEVAATLDYVREGAALYDDVCLLTLRTESGLIGRVVQDVVTRPARKRARLQGREGAIEWVNGYGPDADAVITVRPGKDDAVDVIPKRRRDDFIDELSHLAAELDRPRGSSPIDVERGLDTMLVLAAAHRAERDRRRVMIDYRRGYRLEALSHG